MADVVEMFAHLRVDSAKVREDVQKGIAGVDATKAGEGAGTTFGSGFKAKAGAAFTSAVGSLAKIGVGSALAIGGASIKMAADFQAGLTTLVTGAGEAEGNLKMVGAGILSISASSGTSTKQLTDGMFMIESAGFHGAAGLAVLKAAAEGAKIGNADLGVTANALTTVMKDYGAKAGTATQATDGLMAIVSNGKVHLEDLASSMSRVLPTAAALNISFAGVGGAMATMTGEGTSARLAAMGLNATILALSVPSKVAAKEMASLGLSSRQVADDLTHKGLIFALNEVQAAALRAGPVGSAPYVAAMKAMLGGTNGLRVGLQLTGIHMKDLVANTLAVGQATHSTEKDVTGWALVQKDVNQQMEVLKARVEVAAIQIGQKLIPAVSGFLGFLMKTHLIIPLVATAVGILTAAIVAQGVMWVVTGVQAVISMVKMAASLTVLTAMWILETTAVESSNVAMLIAMGSMGLIVVAVAALAFGIYELYKHWDTVFSFVKHTAMDVYGWIKANWPLLAAILLGPVAVAALEIRKHWDTIKKVFSDAAGFIKGIFAGAATWISAPFVAEFTKIRTFITTSFDAWWKTNGDAIKEIWRALWSAISAVFHAWWDPQVAVLKAGWAVIQALFTAGTAVLRAVWSAGWAVISGIARAVWPVVTAEAKAALAALTAAMTVAWAVMTAVWRTGAAVVTAIWNVLWATVTAIAKVAWAGIQAFFKIAWDILVGIFTVAINLLTGRWGAAWTAMRNTATQVWNAIKAYFGTELNALASLFTTVLRNIGAVWSAAWNSVRSVITTILTQVLGWVQNGFLNPMKNAFQTVVSAIGTIWRGIQNAVATPVRFVINQVYDKVAGVFDDVTGFLGLGRPLPIVTMAGGGRVPGTGRGDKIPALLEPDEIVLSNPQIARAGGHAAVEAMFGPGGGTVQGSVLRAGLGWNPISDIVGAAKAAVGAAKAVGGALTGGAKWVAGHVEGLIKGAVLGVVKPVLDGILSSMPALGSGSWGADIRQLPRKMVDGLLNWISGKDQAATAATAAMNAAAGGKAGGGVQQWKALVLKALGMEHLSASLVNDVLYQMQTESGGNSRAINNWDSNAAAGTPSKGLMQVIQPTFNRWHWPGTSGDIYDPLANIAAAINYSAHGRGFGSGPGQMGSGHGYAAGGQITEPMIALGMRTGRLSSLGEHGIETIVPGGQRGGDGAAFEAAMLARLDRLIATTAAVPAGVGRHVGGAIGGAAQEASFRNRYPR